MKKFILLLLMPAIIFAQDAKVKAYVEQTAVISFEQYDLIKKVNEYYPDLLVSRAVVNTYKNDLKTNVLIESYLTVPVPIDCVSYSILIYPDNTAIDYSYLMKKGLSVFGSVHLFNGVLYRTYYSDDSRNKVSRYYINDKLISEVNY